MVTLPLVEVPGLADAIRREGAVRDSAFIGGKEIVCGVTVNPLSLKALILLEAAGNAFVTPMRFDDLNEACAHAIQILYFCSDYFSPPVSPRFNFWMKWSESIKVWRFIAKTRKENSISTIISEVRSWLDDAFMDAGSGSTGEIRPPSYASYPACIIDRFADAGLPHTEKEIMEMPLKKLWQHMRLAERRLYGFPLTNPSDEIAVNFIR